MYLALLAFLLPLAGDGTARTRLDGVLERLVEEAEAFQRIAPRTLSEETLEQRTAEKPPRFRPRLGAAVARPAEPRFRTRRVVSEYGYSTLEDSPGVLHELRQIVSVDGRQVRKPQAARLSLSTGVSSRDDRIKRQMLREFENQGLAAAAVDMGQVILLFVRRRLADYEFSPAGSGPLPAGNALIFAFRQVRGPGSVTIFEGRNASRQAAGGEVWARESDGLPLRIVIRTERREGGHVLRDEAAVDYSMSPHGTLLPAGVAHRELLDGVLQVENLFRYAPFRMFSADTQIRFTEAPGGETPER